MKKLSKLIMVFLILVLGAGCVQGNPELPEPAIIAQAPEDLPSSPSCITGIWEIVNKEDFARALVPVGSFERSKLGSISTFGSAAYRYDEAGVLTVEAASFQGEIDILDETTTVKLVIKMDGFARGHYQTADGMIELTDMIRSDMFFSALYDGEEMMSDMRADGFLPLFVAPYNSAEFLCEDNGLSLTFSNNPNLSQPLLFKRLR